MKKATADSKSYREAIGEKEQDHDEEQIEKLKSKMTPEEFLDYLESDGFTDIAIKDDGYGNYALSVSDWKSRGMRTGLHGLTTDLFPRLNEYYSIPRIRHELKMNKKRELEWDMPYPDMTEEDVLNHFESLNYTGIVLTELEDGVELRLKKPNGERVRHYGPMMKIIWDLFPNYDKEYSFEELRDELARQQEEGQDAIEDYQREIERDEGWSR